MTLVVGGIAIAGLCCSLADRTSSWIERLGAITMVLAMLDGAVLPRVAAPLAWAGLLTLMATAGAARLRFTRPSSSTRMIGIHRAIGLLSMAASLATMSRSAPTDGQPSHAAMSEMQTGAPGIVAIVLLALTLALTASMCAHWIRRRRIPRERQASAPASLNMIEAGMMAIMLITMNGLAPGL